MTRRTVDGPSLLRAAEAALANLERYVAEVDELNVFPVPDGDTGSNMLATMRAAVGEASRLPEGERDLEAVAGALRRGALTGARGNSGVILSQIIRGMAEGVSDPDGADGADLARGLRRGAEAAYESVLAPVEGTILTVVRDAASAAERTAGRRPMVATVLATAVDAAADSVARTPSLLPLLADAGVVDSGGQGLYRLLEGTLQTDSVDITAVAVARSIAFPGSAGARREERPSAAVPARPAPTASSSSTGGPDPRASAAGAAAGFGYETEYLLESADGTLDIDAVRRELLAIGESVVVAGDTRAARIHVHGTRPDLAIAVGLRAGRPSSIAVKDLDAQAAGHAAHLGHVHDAGTGRSSVSDRLALVAVAPAPGLAEAFRTLGAEVVEPASGDRPAVGEIAAVIRATGAGRVIVLPNDRDAYLAAGQAAASLPGVEVVVLPTRNAAEGVAAALAFDAGATIGDNAGRMEAEAAQVGSFSVVIAVRDAVVDGREVKRGQAIAIDPDKRLLACEDGLLDAAERALATFDEPELVTIYHGAAVAPAFARELLDRLVTSAPETEIELVEGGQRFDRLLIAVE